MVKYHPRCVFGAQLWRWVHFSSFDVIERARGEMWKKKLSAVQNVNTHFRKSQLCSIRQEKKTTKENVHPIPIARFLRFSLFSMLFIKRSCHLAHSSYLRHSLFTKYLSRQMSRGHPASHFTLSLYAVS